MKLLIIEAPGKRKKLQKILGPTWQVVATSGHIRELAKSGPDNLGFTLGEDGTVRASFVPRSEISKKVIRKLQALSPKADKVSS